MQLLIYNRSFKLKKKFILKNYFDYNSHWTLKKYICHSMIGVQCFKSSGKYLVQVFLRFVNLSLLFCVVFWLFHLILSYSFLMDKAVVCGKSSSCLHGGFFHDLFWCLMFIQCNLVLLHTETNYLSFYLWNYNIRQ